MPRGLDGGGLQTAMTITKSKQLDARVKRLERIVAALKAIYRCRYHCEFAEAEKKLKESCKANPPLA